MKNMRFSTMIFLMIFILIQTIPLFADLGMAGAELPYSNDWYKNPALQNTDPPAQVFTSPASIPLFMFRSFILKKKECCWRSYEQVHLDSVWGFF